MAIILKYNLDESSGTVVNDSVGTNTATATASYPIVNGIRGLARDGASGDYQIIAGTQISLTTRAYSCWAKISGTISTIQRLLSIYPGGTHNDYIRTNNGADIRGINGYRYRSEAVYNMTVNDGKWHYYYVDTTTGYLGLYVDGVLRATGGGTSSGLGTFSASGYYGGGEYFKGTLDEICLFNSHIGTAQVKNQYSFYKGYF